MSQWNRNVLKLMVSLVLVFSFIVGTSATTLLRMDLTALARSAEIIVRARCIHSEMRWESESIWTFNDFDVLEVFKGVPSQTLRIRLPGGHIGHVAVKIEGVPAFTAGEEIILFVEKASAGDYGVTSWAQGTFRVRRQSSGESVLTQDTSHVSVFDPRVRQFAPAGIRNLKMSDFRQQLAQALVAPDSKNQRK